jgi:hypothetical protein
VERHDGRADGGREVDHPPCVGQPLRNERDRTESNRPLDRFAIPVALAVEHDDDRRRADPGILHQAGEFFRALGRVEAIGQPADLNQRQAEGPHGFERLCGIFMAGRAKEHAHLEPSFRPRADGWGQRER